MPFRASSIVSFLMVVGLCLAIPSAQSFAQETPPTPAPPTSDQDNQLCTVAGTVVSLATGEPLKNADVLLNAERIPGHPVPRLTTTDAAGHFLIERVESGRYYLDAYREGYVPSRYGQSDPREYGAMLSLAPGQKISDLIFRMQRYAVITGRVVDEDGQPMVRVHVDALRSIRAHDSTKLEQGDWAQTDDQGVYRIFNLVPGRYAVRASLTEGDGLYFGDNETPQRDGKDPRSDYQPMYFPGTTDATRAAILDLKSGDEVPRVDFSFASSALAKTYRIRGRVANSMSAELGPIVVAAMPHDPELAAMAEPDMHLSARADAKTGAFMIDQVPPGTYTVVAETFEDNKMRSTTQAVSVTDADADGLLLVLTRGIQISGSVRFEGSAATAAERVRVLLQPKDQEFASESVSPVQKDGTFTLTEVADGEYSVRVLSNCVVCYTKAAAAGSTNLLKTGTVVSSGDGPGSIEIVYSANTGTASGTVTGADDLPAPGAYVMLVPESGVRGTEDDTKSDAITDQYGRFEIRGVPPGHYKALAWQKFDADSSGGPETIKPFADKADSFEVSSGATAALQLKVIPASASEPAN
jgi:protocatechuate 3,4-dioxygenase beta subunit